MIARTVVLLFAAAAVHAAELARDDFAYSIEIVRDGDGSVYRAVLTSDVYRNVTRADLGDLRVYNGAHEVVPHAITRPKTDPTMTLVDLPLFAVSAPVSASDDISLQVTRGKDGSIVNVRTRPAKPDEPIFYVADASAVKEPLAALEVQWDENRETRFVAALDVDQSDDLKTWQRVGHGAIAALAREGNVLTQRRVELTPRRAKYLRLTWAEAPPSTRLTRVRAELRRLVEPARDWMAATSVESAPQIGEYRFDVAGRMPIDRVRVLLPTNSVARVSLSSRVKDGDPWRLRGQKIVFDLSEGARSIRDNEIDVGRGDARQWLLRLERNGGGLGADGPKLEFGWVPDELVFVARGAAPFTLAYGSARAGPVQFGVDALLRSAGRDGEPAVTILPARLGERTVLRGDAALFLPWYRGDWKQWALWGVLLAAVAALAYVAIYLLRALRHDG
jgi:uncharacterized protein DUF3999